MTGPIYRPLIQQGAARPKEAMPLAGGPLWFTHVEALRRCGTQLHHVRDLPQDSLANLTRLRPPVAGLTLDRPRIMGILNVTPDSFSDGGQNFDPAKALASARHMIEAGADILDIGGESTRPGAGVVPIDQEVARVTPVISAIRAESDLAISIDTRKAKVARAAIDVGATLINDVSGFTYDPHLMDEARLADVPVCVMHALGDPETMQQDPRYDHVLIDIYEFLAARVAELQAAGIAKSRILVDPGIGFGKTADHNLTLLRNIGLFHGLGCPVLLGASRKRFIGTIGKAALARNRAPGSIAVGLAALAQGVHILRVHDVADTVQALRLWQAVR